MKKLLVMLMSAALVFSLASCGDSESEAPESSDSSSTTEAETEPETEPETEAASDSEDETSASDDNEGEPSQDGQNNTASDSAALAILATVWDSYGENDRFAAFGGDLTDENLTMDAPGVYTLADPEAMDSALGFPAAYADKIDDAASLMNMLNANTFTCGAYHLTDQADTDDTVSALKDNILARQWLCGFPEKLVIVTVDDFIISVFGHNEPIDTFIEKLEQAYPSAQLVVEEPIM